MPSSGSTTQRTPLTSRRGRRPPPPARRRPGRAAAIRSRIRRSALWSASLTRSVGVLLDVIRRSGPRKASRSSAPASRATDSASARSSPVRHAATAGRCARTTRGPARAGRRARRAAPRTSNGPTSCTASGKPSGVKPAGTDDRRLAGVVERAAVGRAARLADERSGRRCVPSYSRTRSGRRVNIGVSTTSLSSKIRFSRSASSAAGDGGRVGDAGAGSRVPIRAMPLRAAREPVAMADLDGLVAERRARSASSTRLPIVRPQSNSRSTTSWPSSRSSCAVDSHAGAAARRRP